MKSLFTYLLLLTAILSFEKAHAQPMGCLATFNSTTDSSGNHVSFNNTSSGSYTSLFWSFGDGTGSSQNNPVHVYNTQGPWIVCLTIWDSINICQSTTCDTVYGPVTNTCSAYFGMQVSAANVYFYGYLTSGNNPVSYIWDFGDGTTGTSSSPQHNYATAGTYQVCLQITTAGGCVANYCNSVVVNSTPPCNASFTAQSNGLFNSIQFINTSVGNNQTYYWTFGDGTSSTQNNPVHIYATAGTYQACLTVGNPVDSCYSTFCSTITVGNTVGCNAQFGVQNVQLAYTFYASSSAGMSHYWNFGDGTISYSASPTHTYAGAGTYQVCHTITDSINQCNDTWCDTIIISVAGCTVNYTYTTDSTGTLLTFSGSSTGVQGIYQWSFGDGTGGQGASITHQFINPGAYIICLSVMASPNGGVLCSFCDSVIVGSANVCVPVFYTYPDSNVIGNGNLNFGIYNPCGGTQYVWTFGDGTTGSGSSPVHNYSDSGWYNVCVTAFTPNGTYQFCDSVYSFRLSTGINETAASIRLNVFPNPVRETSGIEFILSQKSEVTITLTDIQGKIQSVVYKGSMQSGRQHVDLNAGHLQSGIYLINMIVNGSAIHQRIAVE
ncbi:MAG: PKD domain-containing protein [Bacteroidota bacterium]